MKLGINAIDLYSGKIGGAEQYLRNIIEQFKKYKDVELYLFLNSCAFDTFDESDNMKKIQIDSSYDSVIQLQGYIDYYMLDVWFCPLLHLVPENCGIPNATTIFDIQPYYYPEYFDRNVLEIRKRLTDATARKTDKIFTVSEYSKHTIVEKLNYPEERIVVTNLDADRSFYLPCDERTTAEIKKGLPDKYILFPANMWPHKNHINLLKAYVIIKNDYHLDLKLVFTGAKEKESANISQFISDNDLREDITYLGYIPQDAMRYVYKFASMLAFPTKFEGFPLPIVEAMRMDVPIVCSNSTCLPEMAKDAALMFDPDKPEKIAQAIARVYTDNALRIQLLENAGKIREDYSWEKCAAQTMEELRKLCGEKTIKDVSNREMPLVSIITPSFNQGEFIKDTIESVLSQSYKNIEYIVMDGGSDDNTVEILKSYGDHINWVSEKDSGQSDAINKGIAKAQGSIIGWLNSDDTYYPDAVELIVNTFLSHPGADMVYGEGNYTDRDGKETTRFNTRIFDYEKFAEECTICQPTAFFKKELFEKVGGLRNDLHLCMDYELWMRMGKVSKPLYIPKEIATSRMYEENKTMSFRAATFLEVFNVLKEHYGYVPESWLKGYVHHVNFERQEGKKHLFLSLALKYNWNKPGYLARSVIPPLKRKAYGYFHNRIAAETPQNIRYSDGWISKEYTEVIHLLGGESDILIKGRNLLFRADELELTVQINDTKKNFPIKQQEFEIYIPVEHSEKELTVSLFADKIRRPSVQDPRKLSVIIDQIIPINRNGEKPLVSVITPSYNQGKFIRRTIESVLSQDYENIEYIVVDGGSTDETLSILMEYSGRLKYISEPDEGQANAINKGFKMAKGEIIAWLNSDDVYEPGAVSKVVNVFNISNAALIYGKGYIIDENDVKLKPFEYIRSFNLWALINVCDYILQPAAFFKKEAFNLVGCLNEKLNWAMDWDLWIRLALKYNVVYLEDFLACSREYGETKTSTGGDKRLEEIRELLNTYSGKEDTFGYQLCKLAEDIKHVKSRIEYDMQLSRLSQMVQVQPSVDTNGYCSEEANFYVKPEDNISELQIQIEEEEVIGVSIWLDDDLIYKSWIGTGIHKIAINPDKSKISSLNIRIDSERIRTIQRQSESGVKICLL